MNEPTEPRDENRLIAERRAKLQQLRAQSTPFPNDFRRDALAGQLHTAYGQKSAEWLEKNPQPVNVGGRMMLRRVMGKASFAQIQDRTGEIQLFLQQDVLGDVYEAFRGWDIGDIVGAQGTLFRTRTGELSVKVSQLRLLVKSLRPLPDKWHGLADTELRYRQRYVDLTMSEESREIFRTRTRIVRYLRDFLDALDFLEVETPMLQPVPGGAVARPFVTHHNALDMQMFLRIAPELYLKRLVVGGFERVYEINRNFRNEGLSTQHNPEFTMLELYWAYGDYRDVMDWVEKAFRGLADAIRGTRKSNTRVAPTISTRRSGASRSSRHCSSTTRTWIPCRCAKSTICIGSATSWRSHIRKPMARGSCRCEIFEKTVEARLLDPTFVYAYPTEVSPLSRSNDQDPFITDRFELFVAGRELANGFSELNDPEEQAARFRSQAARKAEGDEEAMYFDADYIRALEYGMPPAAGLGVGIDRLVMFFTDRASIRDVLLFPHLRPE